MSKEYEVLVPFAGYVSVIVEADSEEEAIDKGLETDFILDLKSDDAAEIQEFDTFEIMCQGNVLYAPLNEAEASEIG